MKAGRRFARSLFVVKDVKAGDKINNENVRCIRPGYGLHPKYYRQIQNASFTEAIKRGTPLEWQHIKDLENVEELKKSDNCE